MELMRDAQWEVLPTLWNVLLVAQDRVTQNDHDPLVVVLLVLLFFFATAVVEPGKVCVQLSVAATLWIALASLLEQVVGVLLYLAWRAWGEAPSGVAERVVCVISHIVCLVLLMVNPPFLRLGQDTVELEGAQDASEERGKHCVVYLAGRPCGLRVAVAASVVICSSCALLDHLFEGLDRTCKTPAAGGTDRRAVRGLLVVLAIIARLALAAGTAGAEGHAHNEWAWQEEMLRESEEERQGVTRGDDADTRARDTLARRAARGDRSGDCVICFDREADVVFTRCGHLAYCDVCHTQVVQNAERSRDAARQRRAPGNVRLSLRWTRCPICQQESRTCNLDDFSGHVYQQQLH